MRTTSLPCLPLLVMSLLVPSLLALGTMLLVTACGSEPTDPVPTSPLEFGDVLPKGITRAIASPKGTWNESADVASRCGRSATVFYAWSVPCPCVDSVEPRIQNMMTRYGALRGVKWMAVAGEPLDRRVQYREKVLRLDTQYPLIEDPDQILCRVLSLNAACEVAVLNEQRELVYRGAIDDDYIAGKGEHLAAVLDAVLAGKPVEPRSRTRTYGCIFNDPASCVQRGGAAK